MTSPTPPAPRGVKGGPQAQREAQRQRSPAAALEAPAAPVAAISARAALCLGALTSSRSPAAAVGSIPWCAGAGHASWAWLAG